MYENDEISQMKRMLFSKDECILVIQLDYKVLMYDITTK